MKPTTLIGKTITNIWEWCEMEVGGLDQAEVFLELDGQITIGFPVGLEGAIEPMKVKKGSKSLLEDCSDTPIYQVNLEGKSIEEVVKLHKKRASSIWGKLKSILGLNNGIPKEYIPHRVEYQENKLKYLKNQKIKDLLLFEKEWAVFIELENGFFITEIGVAPYGLGRAGLNLYENVEKLEEWRGEEYSRLVG